MDIITAFRYQACGYRIRRPNWGSKFYIDAHNMTFIKLSSDDVSSDDWEIITDGIIKDFPITYLD
jgi:hypothetical protein